MLLKNNKGNLVEVKFLNMYYGAKEWKEVIGKNIIDIEMYENGYIKRIEWKDEEKWKNTVFCATSNNNKGILCYSISLDIIEKDNICKVDYKKDGGYYTLFLNLQLDKNTKLLSNDEGYLCVFVNDEDYNYLTNYCNYLKDKQIIRPYSSIELIKDELVEEFQCNSAVYITKHITYKDKENNIYIETKYDKRNI